MNDDSKSRIVPALSLLTLVGGLALLIVFFPGCGKPPTISDEKGGVGAEKEDPWPAARKRLRKDTNFEACRLTLGKLNSELPSDPKAPKPRGLTSEEEESLAKLVPLSKEDRDEVRSATFTPHDSAYVAECLYLRDAARSFDIPGKEPDEAAARRADTAFAWVCRQVYLNPLLVPSPNDPSRGHAAVLPPSWVLRRGSGSGLERMYVMLGLLQQMGLEGCLVGPAKAENLSAGFVALDPDNAVLTGTPRGPFWAVGVRIGNDVRLYDPWRGQAFPMTLSQLRTNPDAHKAWFEDKANVSGITAALAKEATTYLAVPVNSLAPRMVTLEEQMKADLGAKFAIDATKLRDAFADPKPAFWNPQPVNPHTKKAEPDQFAYGRTARLFLPTELGGTDPSGIRAGLFGFYLLAQLPPPQQLLPAELATRPELLEDVGTRIVNLARGGYELAFIQPPPNPRERFQRGQFQDAARELVSRQDMFALGLERLRNNPDADKQIKAWAEALASLYTERGLALTRGDREGAATAREAIDAHWTKHPALLLVVERAVAPVGLAQATLLLAECKHEQAERLQTQLALATGDTTKLRQETADAWSDARHAWESFAPHAAALASFPGRVEHAKWLTARAEEMTKKK